MGGIRDIWDILHFFVEIDIVYQLCIYNTCIVLFKAATCKFIQYIHLRFKNTFIEAIWARRATESLGEFSLYPAAFHRDQSLTPQVSTEITRIFTKIAKFHIRVGHFQFKSLTNPEHSQCFRPKCKKHSQNS